MGDSEGTQGFIDRWQNAGASERANAQLFLTELADLLGVERASNSHFDGYSFEFPVRLPKHDGTFGEGRIDLYKRGCFVLEAKQFAGPAEEPSSLQQMAEDAGIYQTKKKSGPVRGTGAWDEAMLRARAQAERYARSLPADEPTPPFLLVVDVGHSIEVFADFTQAGKSYLPFPDPRSFRIRLADLADEAERERLRRIWTDPFALDPTKISAAVTREIAGYLAELASSLEKQDHPPRLVAEFLTRCLFCMFAEDVGLLPKDSFRGLLEGLRGAPEGFVPKLRTLFAEMQTGTDYSVILNKKLLRFNGGLFEDASVLPLDGLQLSILIKASTMQWRDVEPAIFGTLLERALDPHERHKLGAHYTPRAYVERLVLPTVVEPLRADWDAVRTAAVVHAKAGRIKDARQEIRRFHDSLCSVRILDPACGSGNFLYVTLEHLKRLEGEVLDAAADFGENMLLDLETHTVDPHQFLGIELNPRAAALAELVLWIGYLQWHLRTRGNALPAEPVLKKFRNIECRDAVLAWDGDPVPVTDDNGNPVTTWDRRSMKVDLVTGRNVPDETKRLPILSYPNARPAEWPQADYIVGNPPFLGASRMRDDLGDGYTETLRAAYPTMPESADFVMFWWHKAAALAVAEKIKRFGFITTNSLRQTFNRRVIERAGENLAIRFAIPDHPWVDTQEGAAVRIAMTVAEAGQGSGTLLVVENEEPNADGSSTVMLDETRGSIAADLTVGADLNSLDPLSANDGLANRGFCLFGAGFIVSHEVASSLGLGTISGLENYILDYRNGKDLTSSPRRLKVIDLFGLSSEEVREQFPAVYQHVLTHVKPERDHNNRQSRRNYWWIFGEPNKEMRRMLNGLPRYIATVETSKHRVFQFLDSGVRPDNKLVVIALRDAFSLGILTSYVHTTYALAAGSWLGVGNDPVYAKTRCFDPFPFPACSEEQKSHIRAIAEELDAHRKRVQAQHPTLTLTGMYNVLEALRQPRALTAKEQVIHDTGLVSILRQLHDDLDAAVFDAYSWSDLWEMQQDAKAGGFYDFKIGATAQVTVDPAAFAAIASEFQRTWEQELLTRLVALNAQRAAEEANGQIRCLRPEYQNKNAESKKLNQSPLNLHPAASSKQPSAASKKKAPWPKSLADRVRLIDDLLRTTPGPNTAQSLAKQFARASEKDIEEILETLAALGRLPTQTN